MDESFVLIRLTALWALSEAGLGGLLHLFRSPFTGLIVGSISVMLISLIAYSSKRPYLNIIKALLLVLMVKMTVSPHSPIPAYFAVAFQGLTAAVLFSLLPYFRFSCLLLGLLSLMESALQKILTLSIIFGKSIWEAIDAFVAHVSRQLAGSRFEEGSLWLIGFYIGLYALAGIFAGWFAGRLPDRIEERLEQNPNFSFSDTPKIETRKRQPIWKTKKFRYLIITISLIILIYYFVPGSKAILDPVWLLARVFLVLAFWYLVIGPFIMDMLRRFLDRKTGKYKEEVAYALSLLPVFRSATIGIWKSYSGKPFITRARESLYDLISFSLLYKSSDYEPG